MQPDIRELSIHLSQETDGDNRSRFLAQHPELLEASVVEALAETVRTTVRIDVPQSLALAEAALAIATELKDEHAQARSRL